LRFGDKDWRYQLQKAAQDHKFEATLKPRLDAAIEDWHATQPGPAPPPVVDFDELRIHAAWIDD